MALPHQAIILCLTSIGHGAAAWIMWRRDVTSYLPRTSSGSASRRWNWVGTMCEVVTRHSSMSRSMSSGSHLSISTIVWPRWMEALPKAEHRGVVQR